MEWIILANTNVCHIYYYNKISDIRLFKEISHPENKLKNQELDTDKPGRYYSVGQNRGTYEKENTSLEQNINSFAHEIAQELENAADHNQYEALTLIMPSQIYGLVKNHLSKKVHDKVKKVIQKNIMNLPANELNAYLEKAG